MITTLGPQVSARGADDGAAVRLALPLIVAALLPAPAVAATVLTDAGIYQAQLLATPGLGAPATLGFEEWPIGLELGAQHVPTGPAFEGPAPRVVLGEAFGAAARGTRLLAVGYTATANAQVWLRFVEPQRALGFHLVDGGTPLLVETLDDGTLVEAFTLDVLSENIDGGLFVGFLLAEQADEVRIISLGPEDGFGLDDVLASSLGSVDNDEDGHSELEGDCDDLRADVAPGLVDLCDDEDSDCDGFIDENADGDGDGFSLCSGDCDDTDAARSPAAPEVCGNDRDEDCDGATDDDGDLDGDGFSPCEGDCDDEDSAETPGGAELCDGHDNDCDGLFDEQPDLDGDGFTACDGDCDDQDLARTPLVGCAPEDVDDDPPQWNEPAVVPGPSGVGGGGCTCDAAPRASSLALLLLPLLLRRRR